MGLCCLWHFNLIKILQNISVFVKEESLTFCSPVLANKSTVGHLPLKPFWLKDGQKLQFHLTLKFTFKIFGWDSGFIVVICIYCLFSFISLIV